MGRCILLALLPAMLLSFPIGATAVDAPGILADPKLRDTLSPREQISNLREKWPGHTLMPDPL